MIESKAQIISIFRNAEETSACHEKNAFFVKNLIDKNVELLQEIFNLMERIFVADYNNTITKHVDKVIDFLVILITSFKPMSTSDEDEIIDNPIFKQFFDFLFKCSKLRHEFVRYWSCKLIDKILINVEDVSEDIFDTLKETLFERLLDTKATIRFFAVRILQRLQDPRDKKDKITLELINIISTELNTNTRQLALEKIALRDTTINAIILRTRDVKEVIRLTAFKKLSKFFKFIDIHRKQEIIRNCFTDDSAKVKEYINTELLETILQSYDNDYLKLMASLRSDSCIEQIEETVWCQEKVLNVYFRNKPLNEFIDVLPLTENNTIPFEKLELDLVVFYLTFIRFLRQEAQFEDQLVKVVPDLTIFCTYIKEYVCYSKPDITDLKTQCILEHLFKIIIDYDMSDSVTRSELKSLIYDLLVHEDLSSNITSLAMDILEKIIENISDLSIFICEIVSDIAYTLDSSYVELQGDEKEKRLKISQLTSELYVLREEHSHYSMTNQSDKAEETKELINAKKSELDQLEKTIKTNDLLDLTSDFTLILRYLNVAEAHLKSSKLVRINPAIQMLKSNLIQQQLVNELEEVKLKSLKCFGLIALLNVNYAKSYVNILSLPIIQYRDGFEVDVETLINSIAIVGDLLLTYGSSIVAAPTDNFEQEEEEKVFTGLSLTDVINGIVELLDDETCEIQETALETLCKLTVHGRFISPDLFATFVLKLSNESTENKLKDQIGETLHLCSTSQGFPKLVKDIVIKTLKSKDLVPSSESFAEIDLNFLVNFLVSLCESTDEGRKIQTELAIQILSELRDKNYKAFVPIFVKFLMLLNIEIDLDSIQNIVDAYSELNLTHFTKKDANNLTKFITNIKSNVKSEITESISEEISTQ